MVATISPFLRCSHFVVLPQTGTNHPQRKCLLFSSWFSFTTSHVNDKTNKKISQNSNNAKQTKAKRTNEPTDTQTDPPTLTMITLTARSATRAVARLHLAPHAKSAIFVRQAPVALASFHTPTAEYGIAKPQRNHFSSAAVAASTTTAPNEIGTVTKPLKVLDMRVVRQIKAELMEVDANSDGR